MNVDRFNEQGLGALLEGVHNGLGLSTPPAEREGKVDYAVTVLDQGDEQRDILHGTDDAVDTEGVEEGLLRFVANGRVGFEKVDQESACLRQMSNCTNSDAPPM